MRFFQYSKKGKIHIGGETEHDDKDYIVMRCFLYGILGMELTEVAKPILPINFCKKCLKHTTGE